MPLESPKSQWQLLKDPLKVVFKRKLSSIKNHLPTKVVFHQRVSSIKVCIPSKVVFQTKRNTPTDWQTNIYMEECPTLKMMWTNASQIISKTSSARSWVRGSWYFQPKILPKTAGVGRYDATEDIKKSGNLGIPTNECNKSCWSYQNLPEYLLCVHFYYFALHTTPLWSKFGGHMIILCLSFSFSNTA